LKREKTDFISIFYIYFLPKNPKDDLGVVEFIAYQGGLMPEKNMHHLPCNGSYTRLTRSN